VEDEERIRIVYAVKIYATVYSIGRWRTKKG